jgi:hypothetical protein
MERYDPKKDPAPEGNYRVKPFEHPTAEVNLGFHGTARGLEGDQLRPDIGRENPVYSHSGARHINYWSVPNAGATPEAEEAAWEWASSPKFSDPDDPSEGRPRVHEVRARGLPGPDPNATEDPDAHNVKLANVGTVEPIAATHADVTRTLWIPPPTAEAKAAGRGVQGTLEHINWNQFGLSNVGNPEDEAGGVDTDEIRASYGL